MFWTCYDNCSSGLWPSFREDWASIGVRALLGFNEPDNKGQSNLSPKQAAAYWPQLDDLAQSFDPPLTLVGPGMTHWDSTGGSPWLDQFFGNLSAPLAKRILYLAQHDYSGGGQGIISRADAAYRRYGRKVWLTEFSVGKSAGRAANDRFAAEVLPLLDEAESVARYAWYSARNRPDPDGWVNASSLLPPVNNVGWSKTGKAACAEMAWVGEGVGVVECQILAQTSAHCPSPVTVAWQHSKPNDCCCANTTSCRQIKSSWQDLYANHNDIAPPPWTPVYNTACADSEMLWLSQHASLELCQAKALETRGCVADPGRTVIYQSSGVKNCCAFACSPATHSSYTTALQSSIDRWMSADR